MTRQGHSHLRSHPRVVEEKRMIKAMIPPEFLLEWFLKSLFPYISKDVSTSGVSSKEEAIFRAQQLDLIYSQSGILYKIFSDAHGSSTDPMKSNSRPHVDGIVSSVNNTTTDLVASQMKQMTIHQTVIGQATNFDHSHHPIIRCTCCAIDESKGYPTTQRKKEE
jgi:hypothetical protein